MMKSHFLLFVLAIAIGVSVDAASVQQGTCEHFFLALKSVRNEKLTCTVGEFDSLHDGKKYFGCEVTFVTNDALRCDVKNIADFSAKEGTTLYRHGWRRNRSYDADGPGTSMYGIERGDDLCLISSAQPSSIEESPIEGRTTFLQSETLTIMVQCRKK